MTESNQSSVPQIPKYGALIWIQDGTTDAFSARFSDKLRLHVNGGMVNNALHYMSGVVLAADNSLQAAAFYADDTEYAKQLSYQLAIVIAPDFI